MDNIKKTIEELKNDIMELRSETKYITRILDKISETLEENKQINMHLVKVAQKTEYHENRLLELKKM